MKKSLKKNAVLTVSIIVAMVLVLILFYDGVKNQNHSLLSGLDRNLLYRYTPDIDLNSLYSKNNEITQVATGYSVLYKEFNRRKMYVSSLPVRGVTQDGLYVFTNTTIEALGNGLHKTKNTDYDIIYSTDTVHLNGERKKLQIFFPNAYKKGCVEIEKSASLYDSDVAIQYVLEDGCLLSIFPSYQGIVISCEINNPTDLISFPIEFENYRINNEYYGCVLLSEEKSKSDDVMSNNAFIISQPVIFECDEKVNTGGRTIIEKQEKGYQLQCLLPDSISFPAKLTFTCNFYSENMFFDCAAIQSRFNSNHIFDSYIIYDSLQSYDATYNYMKFNIRSFTPKNSHLLDRLLLNLYVLYCKNEITLEIYSVRNDWCSWELTWNNRPQHNEKIGEFTVISSGWYSIDLTEYVKQLIDNNYYNLINNSILFKIRDDSSGYAIFTSTDNGVYPPYFEVEYRVGS